MRSFIDAFLLVSLRCISFSQPLEYTLRNSVRIQNSIRDNALSLLNKNNPYSHLTSMFPDLKKTLGFDRKRIYKMHDMLQKSGIFLIGYNMESEAITYELFGC